LPKQHGHDYALLFFLFFVTFAYFFQGGGWNQNARVCLTRAMLHHHTFIIDSYREDSDDPHYTFINTGDWAYCNGHYYANKTPGLSILATIPFAVSEFVFSTLFSANDENRVLLSTYISTVSTASLCASLLCLLLFHLAIDYLSLSRGKGLIYVLCFGFGTLCFAYSTSFYCHVPSGFFNFFSFVLVRHIHHGSLKDKRALSFLAGLSASTAVLIEPSTIVVLGCIAGYLLFFGHGRRSFPYFLIGCLPAGAIQCYYNAVCFGSPFESYLNYSNDIVMDRIGGELMGLPYPYKFIEMFFLPYRGIFVTSPILVMALPGMFIWCKQKQWLTEGLLCASVFVTMVLLIACFYGWRGGSTVGLRYLLPAFPFLFFFCAFSLKLFSKTFILVGLVSIFINLSIALVGTEIPYNIEIPLTDIIWTNLFAGKVSINPVPISNFHAYPSIFVLANPANWQPNFNSFNLGEIIFPHSPASLLPLVLFWCVWGYFWRSKKPVTCRFVIFSIASRFAGIVAKKAFFAKRATKNVKR